MILRLRVAVRSLVTGCLLLLAACGAQNPASAQVAAPAVPVVAPPAVVAGAAPVAQAGVTPERPLLLPEQARQGDLVIGRILPGSTVRVLERDVRVAGDGTFVFGLDRDAPPEIIVAFTLPDGSPAAAKLRVQAREYKLQKVTGIAERIMNPTAQDLARIKREGAQISAARRTDDDRLDFLQSFIWPAAGPITGVFGSQRYYNGVPKRPHYGVDVGVPVGAPVIAPAAGVVTLASQDMFYSGGTLIIDHGHGVSSTLMHLSEVLVKVGDRVEQGQLVAKSGASGRASGPHLDWRMNWFGEHIDAQTLVPVGGTPVGGTPVGGAIAPTTRSGQ